MRQALTLIHNSGAGGGEWPRERLISVLAAEGFDVAQVHDAKADDLAERLAAARGLVVVAGGDGTVGEVAIGLRHGEATLAIIPTGGANNIARSLGIPAEPGAAIRGLRNCRRDGLRIGRLGGTVRERWFVESIGLGPSAHAAQNPKEGIPPDEKRARVREVIREALAEAEPVKATTVVDGEPLRDPLLMLEVMNITLVGPNLELAPQADPGGGHLIVAWLPVDARDEMMAWLAAPDGRKPPLLWRRGRNVELRLAGDALRIDDEVVDLVDGTVTAELLRQPLEVLVPGGPLRAG